MSNTKKYFKFEKIGNTKSGRTEIWQVINIHKEQPFICGEIRWNFGFRKYSFEPVIYWIFDYHSLRLIADFCETLTNKHYENN